MMGADRFDMIDKQARYPNDSIPQRVQAFCTFPTKIFYKGSRDEATCICDDKKDF